MANVSGGAGREDAARENARTGVLWRGLMRRTSAPNAPTPGGEAAYWDDVADAARAGEIRLPRLVAEIKREAHLGLVRRWGGTLDGARVLKTDLFEEAAGDDAFLPDLARTGTEIHGTDVSVETVHAAVARYRPGRFHGIAADVRRLPYRDGVFDLVVSNSTLDHFASADPIHAALGEFARILRPGGVLIVTLDNPRNVFHPLLRLACRAGWTPFRIGATLSSRRLATALRSAGLEVTDSRAILHNPRLVAFALGRAVERLGWAPLERGVRRVLRAVQRLEGTRWQYWTGSFVAARAVKPGESP